MLGYWPLRLSLEELLLTSTSSGGGTSTSSGGGTSTANFDFVRRRPTGWMRRCWTHCASKTDSGRMRACSYCPSGPSFSGTTVPEDTGNSEDRQLAHRSDCCVIKLLSTMTLYFFYFKTYICYDITFHMFALAVIHLIS